MRKLVIITAAFGLAAATAFAQNAQPAQQGPQNAPIKDMNVNNASAPVMGANSFTEDQAKKRIEAKGFTKVSKLTKDKDGVWRGTAMKAGKSAAVSVDYQGNVN